MKDEKDPKDRIHDTDEPKPKKDPKHGGGPETQDGETDPGETPGPPPKDPPPGG